MRIEDAEQGIGQLGKIVVEFLAHTGGQVGEGFDQAADMRILDRILRQAQAPGDARILVGEGSRRAADI